MTAADYAEFVRQTDWTTNRRAIARNRILRYGLVGEIGSVVAAVKKRVLAEEGVERRSHPDENIGEELGDLLWYCFALYALEYPHAARNALTSAIASLHSEVAHRGRRGERIREWLGGRDWIDFLAQSAALVRLGDFDFDSYQQAAFLTARTSDGELVEVCLAVLTQLGAELLRSHLPPIEKVLNRRISDRSAQRIIGEVIWHVSALAELFGLKLDDIVQANRRKLLFRLDRAQRTPLHDEGAPVSQQIPHRFEVEIVASAEGRSRMVWNERQLGAELTDNAHEPDGYRFHDVMHLANAAVLGWSPVLRALMGRKRKYDSRLDEVEDGARAQIVEEAVVKIIHSEGVRIARERGAAPGEPMIRDKDEISFAFLRLLREMVTGLEVAANRDWEWEDAILAGHRLFAQIGRAQAGVIELDLAERRVELVNAQPVSGI